MAEGRGMGALLHHPSNYAVYKWVDHCSSLNVVRVLWKCSNVLSPPFCHSPDSLLQPEKFDPPLSPKLLFQSPLHDSRPAYETPELQGLSFLHSKMMKSVGPETVESQL